MKLEKWSQIAEIVGSIALVITLVLLLLQVRSANQQTRIANEQVSAMLNMEDARITNELPLLSETLQRALAKAAPSETDPHLKYLVDRYGMTDEEAWTLLRYHTNTWQGLQRWFFREGPSEGLAGVIEAVASPRDHRRLLADWKASDSPPLNPVFWSYINEVLGSDFDWSIDYNWRDEPTETRN